MLFYVNAAIQLGAILLFQHMGLLWPLYIVMGMISILIVVQTLAAGFVLSNAASLVTSKSKRSSRGIGILISFIYIVSCYNIHLIGFTGFAWFAFAHILIQLFANVFGAMKQ